MNATTGNCMLFFFFFFVWSLAAHLHFTTVFASVRTSTPHAGHHVKHRQYFFMYLCETLTTWVDIFVLSKVFCNAKLFQIK